MCARIARGWVALARPEFIRNSVAVIIGSRSSAGKWRLTRRAKQVDMKLLRFTSQIARFSAETSRAANEGRPDRWKRILENYCAVICDDRRFYTHTYTLLMLCAYSRAHAARTARTVPPPRELSTFPIGQKLSRAPWLRTGSTLRDAGPGVTFREYGAINYAVSVIGAERARSCSRSLLFLCSRVCRARYTPAKSRCPRLCYDRAPFCSAGHAEPL